MAKKKTKSKVVAVTESDIEQAEEAALVAELDAAESADPKKLSPTQKKEIYEMWLSIPALVRMLPETELKKMGYDTDNPLFMKLLGIKSARAFAAEFGMSNNTPYAWEKKDPGMRDRANQIARGSHALKFQKDVDFSFTQKVLKHGDANRVKLWYQVMTGWSEKIEHKNTNLNVDVVSLVQEIEKRNAELRAK